MSLKSVDDSLIMEAKRDDTIEDILQCIVNSLTKGMEKQGFESHIFEGFEKLFENSSTLEEILKTVSEMINQFISNIGIQKTNEISVSKKPLDNNNEISSSNYDNLEKILQKYEAEIRDHIKIEQQLKIYSESLEEKLEENEQITSSFEKQKENWKKEKKEILKQLQEMSKEKISLEKKINNLRNREVSSSIHLKKTSKNNSLDSVL